VYDALMIVVSGDPGGFAKSNVTLRPSVCNATIVGNTPASSVQNKHLSYLGIYNVHYEFNCLLSQDRKEDVIFLVSISLGIICLSF
jgi:hypothetical protein